jgi:protein gp37
MGASKIEWTEATWNPVTGCTKVSPGCAHCYAEALTKRYAGRPGWPETFEPWLPGNDTVRLHPDRLDEPLRWKTPRMVFVNSMSDLFHESVPVEFVVSVWAAMALTPQHTYQVLTKRPDLMDEFVNDRAIEHWWRSAAAVVARSEAERERVLREEGPLPNVWLGVSAENQHWAQKRIPALLRLPAAVRFVSAEPLLGPLNLREYSGGLDWVIVGGESGPKHRRFDPDWARQIVADCRKAGVACFVKQLGGARPGNRIEDLPEDLRVREWPVVKGVGA